MDYLLKTVGFHRTLLNVVDKKMVLPLPDREVYSDYYELKIASVENPGNDFLMDLADPSSYHHIVAILENCVHRNPELRWGTARILHELKKVKILQTSLRELIRQQEVKLKNFERQEKPQTDEVVLEYLDQIGHECEVERNKIRVELDILEPKTLAVADCLPRLMTWEQAKSQFVSPQLAKSHFSVSSSKNPVAGKKTPRAKTNRKHAKQSGSSSSRLGSSTALDDRKSGQNQDELSSLLGSMKSACLGQVVPSPTPSTKAPEAVDTSIAEKSIFSIRSVLKNTGEKMRSDILTLNEVGVLMQQPKKLALDVNQSAFSLKSQSTGTSRKSSSSIGALVGNSADLSLQNFQRSSSHSSSRRRGSASLSGSGRGTGNPGTDPPANTLERSSSRSRSSGKREPGTRRAMYGFIALVLLLLLVAGAGYSWHRCFTAKHTGASPGEGEGKRTAGFLEDERMEAAGATPQRQETTLDVSSSHMDKNKSPKMNLNARKPEETNEHVDGVPSNAHADHEEQEEQPPLGQSRLFSLDRCAFLIVAIIVVQIAILCFIGVASQCCTICYENLCLNRVTHPAYDQSLSPSQYNSRACLSTFGITSVLGCCAICLGEMCGRSPQARKVDGDTNIRTSSSSFRDINRCGSQSLSAQSRLVGVCGCLISLVLAALIFTSLQYDSTYQQALEIHWLHHRVDNDIHKPLDWHIDDDGPWNPWDRHQVSGLHAIMIRQIFIHPENARTDWESMANYNEAIEANPEKLHKIEFWQMACKNMFGDNFDDPRTAFTQEGLRQEYVSHGEAVNKASQSSKFHPKLEFWGRAARAMFDDDYFSQGSLHENAEASKRFHDYLDEQLHRIVSGGPYKEGKEALMNAYELVAFGANFEYHDDGKRNDISDADAAKNFEAQWDAYVKTIRDEIGDENESFEDCKAHAKRQKWWTGEHEEWIHWYWMQLHPGESE